MKLIQWIVALFKKPVSLMDICPGRYGPRPYIIPCESYKVRHDKRYPISEVSMSLIRYQVTVQERNEVSQLEIESTAPRLAWEDALKRLGWAPHKFNTTMDIEHSNTRRIVYTSKGRGETVLVGLVKPLTLAKSSTDSQNAD